MFVITKATVKPRVAVFPSGMGYGRHRGDAPYSPMEKRGRTAATEDSSRQQRAAALTLPREGAFL